MYSFLVVSYACVWEACPAQVDVFTCRKNFVVLSCVGTVGKIEYQWIDKVCQEIITVRGINPHNSAALISKKDWIEHLSFSNEVIDGHIGRSNSIH